MLTSDFDYQLPPELIAQEPLPERSESRLMLVHRASGALEHRTFAELPDLLSPGDLLVLNDTRVFPARLFGCRTDTGGKVEVLLVEEVTEDSGVGHVTLWTALMRSGSSPRPGMPFALANGQITGDVVDVSGEGRVRVRLRSDRTLNDVLDEHGVPPVPPYIRRVIGDVRIAADRERYQTVYARERGAVAAPTAGLHFTPAVLDQLDRRGVRRTTITLHVGPGTFRPVKTETVEEHRMDAERYVVNAEAAQAVDETCRQGGRVIAVGSTVVRTLETLARDHGRVVAATGRSELFIRPPFPFKVVDAMLTNFHLPCSTLLMMVAAFAGHELTLRAYAEAVTQRYRFYSYGDCMLIA